MSDSPFSNVADPYPFGWYELGGVVQDVPPCPSTSGGAYAQLLAAIDYIDKSYGTRWEAAREAARMEELSTDKSDPI